MDLLDLIVKKREGGSYTSQELRFLAARAAANGGPDYQWAAWLMAVCLKGMEESEVLDWTRAMARSGKVLDLSFLSRPVADKHSTGGVGDGISLALAPLVAAAGVCVPMISGRALGHTGGTLDKLESIPGFKTQLAEKKIHRQLRKLGVVMIGQSEDLAPADRRLYALRDVTGTVESLPLMVSSILSKKIAEGIGALVLDVKVGRGAFLRKSGQARSLARALVRVAQRSDLKCAAVLSSMDQPLGNAVGNAIEVRQAIEVLRGGGPSDFVELLLELGGWMLFLSRRARTVEAGKETLEQLRRSGAGLDRFRELIRWQGGDPRTVERPQELLPRPRYLAGVPAPHSGYLTCLDARRIGELARLLGAGRFRQEDAVDFSAGIELFKKEGAAVERGEILAHLLTSTRRGELEAGKRLFLEAVEIVSKKPGKKKTVLEILE
ncbi:MAG: thymidine phosphorylase [Elusimicrobia bacterium]|nr:thymidine phosphorylase [Elusimicrobiota bacterium]